MMAQNLWCSIIALFRGSYEKDIYAFDFGCDNDA